MRKRFLRIAILSALVFVSAVGPLTTKTTLAQCGCSCTSDCGGGCDFLCEGCGLFDWIGIAVRCCRENRAVLDCTQQ